MTSIVALVALLSGSASGRTHHISIHDMMFDPSTVTVRKGDVIEFTNTDTVDHTATSKEKAFDTGSLERGKSKRVVVSKRGTFPYSCRFHITMSGTVIVR